MRFTTALLLIFTATSLGSCGGGVDDVEVVLPFVGNVLAKGKTKEAKMVSRGGLVLPPGVQGLPTPKDKQAANDGNSWPVDPDQKAVSDAQTAAIAEKKYRRDGDWSGKRSSGNGVEDFNDKVDWSRRQKGIFQPAAEPKTE